MGSSKRTQNRQLLEWTTRWSEDQRDIVTAQETVPGRELGVVVVGVVRGAVAVALHAARQAGHPAALVGRAGRQQQQLARAVRVQLARRHAHAARLALRHVLRVDLHSAACVRDRDRVDY